MKKFFKWFFGILIALIIVGVILFCCGVLKVKFQFANGIDLKCGIADFQDKDQMRMITKDLDCKFNGFALDFSDVKTKKD